MAAPIDAPWSANTVSDGNLNSTTYGQGTSFPATWSTTRLFWRTDTNKIYQNTGTEGTPVWTITTPSTEYKELTTATTFTPITQTGLVKVTVDATDVTSGDLDIMVDSSSIKNVTSGTFENRVINPVTSLSVISNHYPYYLAGASYDSKSDDISAQETDPGGVTFGDDGTKMYIIGTNDIVYQYTLSTPWDVSSSSYASKSFTVTSQDTTVYSVEFKSDGTKMFIMGTENDSVYQYSLSTAWDVSSASYDSISFSFTSQEVNPTSMTFKLDGTKMYITGNTLVYQYSLTAWDLSTASYDSKSYSVTSQDGSLKGIDFHPDGTKMFIVGGITDKVFQYTLSTPWDVSSASYDSISFLVNAQDTAPEDITFSSDGTKMFILGNTSTEKVYQYSTGEIYVGTARISIG